MLARAIPLQTHDTASSLGNKMTIRAVLELSHLAIEYARDARSESSGAGGETRTHDLGIMRPSLYP